MSMNLTKSKLLCIKGSAQTSLPNYTFEATQSIKDLGLFFTDSLKLDTTREEKNRKSLECILSAETKPLQGKFCNQEKCICLLRRANCQLWRGLVETIKWRFNFT